MDIGLDLYLKLIKDRCQYAKKEEFNQIQSEVARKKTVRIEDIFVNPTLVLDDKNNSTSTFDNVEQEKEVYNVRGLTVINENCEIMNHHSERVRMCICSERGTGKTVLCKRLMLALIKNDKKFVDDCFKGKIDFEDDSIPIFINCDNLSRINDEKSDQIYRLLKEIAHTWLSFDNVKNHNSFSELKKRELWSIISNYTFELFDIIFSTYYSLDCSDNQVTSDSLYYMLSSYPTNKVVLIIDGYERIIRFKQRWFSELLGLIMSALPSMSIVLTVDNNELKRTQTTLLNKSSGKWLIFNMKNLTDWEIDEYCRTWCRINHEQNNEKYQKKLIQQIHIIANWVPLLIRNSQCLILVLNHLDSYPSTLSNKSDFMKFFIETNIRLALRSCLDLTRSLLFMLSYISCELLPLFSITDLTKAVENARLALNEMLVDSINQYPTSHIVSLLLQTGLLEPLSKNAVEVEKERYMFADNEIKDFLKAYAIVYLTYCHKSPAEFYEDKYEKKEWRRVITFSVLFSNRPRIYHNITTRLLYKSKEETNFNYNNLLFEMIANGMKIDTYNKFKIYDNLFSGGITLIGLKNIYYLRSLNNEIWFEFKQYIIKKYNANDSNQFVYAMEALDAINKPTHNVTVELLQSGNRKDIISGISHLQIDAMNEILGVNHDNGITARGDWLPKSMIGILRGLLRNDSYMPMISECIKYAVIAWFVPLGCLLDADDIIAYCQQLSEPNKRYNSELLLSIEPIIGIEEINGGSVVSASTKKEYIYRFEKSIEQQSYEEMVSLYNLCVTIGCWNREEIDGRYKVLSEHFSLSSIIRSAGSAHFMHIRNHQHMKTIKQIKNYHPFDRIYAWEDLKRYSKLVE